MKCKQLMNCVLSEGTCKLQAALSSGSKVDSHAAKVAHLMIETAKSNQANAKRKFEAVREKQKEVSNTNNQKFLEKDVRHQRRESQSKCELSYSVLPLSAGAQLSKE